MKSTILKYLICALKNAFLPAYLIIFIITGSLLVDVADGYGSENMGYVTGKVTVFNKKFFGGLNKKENMSQTVVYITGFKAKAPAGIKEISQKNKRFVPDILPVVAGQQVRFPNRDKIYHNVFSISPLATFDLGQFKDVDPNKRVTFENYGVVPVYCNIHPQMIAYAVVLENSAFAMTDKDGNFRINDLPAGTYTINAWRPKAQRVDQQIVIQAGQYTEVHMELKEVEKIGPHRRKDGSKYPSKSDGIGYKE